jgi:hypothetical protein
VSTKSGEVQTSADNIFFAWQEGIAKAGTNPIHKQQLLQKEAELLPRFAAHYKQLKALARQMAQDPATPVGTGFSRRSAANDAGARTRTCRHDHGKC